MSKKISFYFLLGLLPYCFLISQENGKKQDPKEVLSSVYEKFQSYKNTYIEFSYILKSDKLPIEETSDGTIWIKGDQFVLNLMGNKQIYNGKKLYSISEEFQEINVSSEKSEDLISPIEFLSLYKKDYTVSWDIKQRLKNKTIQYIKLKPNDTSGEIKYALIGIDQKTNRLHNFIQIGKSGVTTKVEVKNMIVNKPETDGSFAFDASKYKGYDIIDLD